MWLSGIRGGVDSGLQHTQRRGFPLRALSSLRVVSLNSDLGIYRKRVMAATPPAALWGSNTALVTWGQLHNRFTLSCLLAGCRSCVRLP